jgi:hypothetical protein
MFRVFFVILASSLLTACMSMPFKGMYKLATLDPLSIDPAQLKLALRTDQVVEVATGSVVMQLEYSSPAHDDLPAIERKHKFSVAVERFEANRTTNARQAGDQQLSINSLPEVLLDDMLPSEQVTLLFLNEQDAKDMAETQRIAKQYKAAGAKGTGMLGFSFNQSCLLNTENMDSLDVDLFLKTAKDQAFFKFFDDLDVIEQARAENVDLKQINQCVTE